MSIQKLTRNGLPQVDVKAHPMGSSWYREQSGKLIQKLIQWAQADAEQSLLE